MEKESEDTRWKGQKEINDVDLPAVVQHTSNRKAIIH
jgi:hypothetical protein